MSSFESLLKEGKKYIDLRVEQLKLQIADSLSVVFANALSLLLVIALVVMLSGILAYALIQWLNMLLGCPWGTLAVAGLYVVLLICVLACRKRLFRNLFARLFAETFWNNED